MINSLITKIFGDPSEKRVKNYTRDLEDIKLIEAKLEKELTSIELVQAKTRDFMARFEGLDYRIDEDYGKIRSILNEIKFEAFATHRIACKLINNQTFVLPENKVMKWSMIPYDVQLVGALALHDGAIAEMRTGEGKTLVATIAAYLNALAGLPVHVVTVNDYLAKRDALEMGIIYRALGLTVGVIVHNQQPSEKQEQYRCNVVYATNNELGFDYLRDNMAPILERRAMGPLFFAIIDEVDSILVDEARTPLIISAPDSEPTSKYMKFAAIAKKLENTKHYKVDEKMKTASLTEEGIMEIERILGIENIYVSAHYNDLHHVENALKAETVYKKDVDYLNRNDEILIIDEHTGRVLSGRRYSDGLHQAIEAKENVTIQQESRTLASITFQNYFRLYRKLSGMTGTAKTEEEEFYKIYRLEVLPIPTNRPMIRDDRSDLLFKNETGKFAYVVKVIKAFHEAGQPVLVGTVSVVKSEYLSNLLTKEGIPHKVLNAKQDANEAEIIGAAGKFGSVTIATNMAGRGTDIKVSDEVRNLSGEVVVEGQIYKLGGLAVIGTEKHETRRIDNQLRGRSGRQGDPGLSQFMVSPQDDIMRIFGGDKLFSIFNAPMFASIPDHEPLIESGMLTKRIDGVQKQVEGRNFDVRKHILEYDDVLNQHRLVIYGRRNKILEQGEIHEDIISMVRTQAEAFVDGILYSDDKYEWDLDHLIAETNTFAGKEILRTEDITDTEDKEAIKEMIANQFVATIEAIRASGKTEDFADFERKLTLQSIDELWMQHIDAMAHLREEVAFEGYAQKNPLIVYKERAFDKFVALLGEIGFKVTKGLLTASPREQIERIELDEKTLQALLQTDESEIKNLNINNLLSDAIAQKFGPPGHTEEGVRVLRADTKPKLGAEYKNIGRNDPCPCGSGKKFKQCHGK
ncbi:preprotein translocase subunit SecA [Candidatus Gracilibacteria bacterium]|nr:preprotein translocase subunit SecA [Candidatus Gracilibacteria bacterium]PIQ11996.1 MAG: preprotein translocase subunit SecA [Candidatus Gracilibacteria bacterium CG18_big_fil_WC_8_21_14_2_50_38_16]PIQ41055.1 MAG: preprotein translocase subunit SecA [Candidatus Gracilibacteria bacterium CG12_big_fil_rev_8_21_14_0_65_38_15]